MKIQKGYLVVFLCIGKYTKHEIFTFSIRCLKYIKLTVQWFLFITNRTFSDVYAKYFTQNHCSQIFICFLLVGTLSFKLDVTNVMSLPQ